MTMFYGLGAAPDTGFAPGYAQWKREFTAYWDKIREEEAKKPQQLQLELEVSDL